MKKCIFVLSIFLSSCSSSDSYLVRFWNGDIISTPSASEQEIWNYCYKKNEHMPNNTYQERENASKAILMCVDELKRK